MPVESLLEGISNTSLILHIPNMTHESDIVTTDTRKEDSHVEVVQQLVKVISSHLQDRVLGQVDRVAVARWIGDTQ